MMRPGSILLIISIIALLIVAGCVAPPKDSSPVSSGTTNDANQGGSIVSSSTTTTPVNVYVTEVTPYVTLVDEEKTASGFNTIAPPTPIPEDRSCRIYSTTQSFLYNGTAFTFDLKNPPMYINYTVIPESIIESKTVTSRYLSKGEVDLKYSTYDPQSYFIITARSKASGKVYLEDGFGTGYTGYITRTIKILDADDMLIEMKGNKITATADFWVKPDGNFDDANNMTFDTCTYWGPTRDNTAFAYATSTTNPV